MKATRYTKADGRIVVRLYGHHRAWSVSGLVKEQFIIAEMVLGRRLSPGETVHHLDGDKGNNDPDNIYIFCSDVAHKSYHERLKAFKQCGHWHWRRCYICKQWDDPNNLYIPPKPNKGGSRHRNCFSQLHKEKYAKRR